MSFITQIQACLQNCIITTPHTADINTIVGSVCCQDAGGVSLPTWDQINLPEVNVGEGWGAFNLNDSIASDGGDPNMSFQDDGTLPDGINLLSNGTFIGTATTASSGSTIFYVTNSAPGFTASPPANWLVSSEAANLFDQVLSGPNWVDLGGGRYSHTVTGANDDLTVSDSSGFIQGNSYQVIYDFDREFGAISPRVGDISGVQSNVTQTDITEVIVCGAAPSITGFRSNLTLSGEIYNLRCYDLGVQAELVTFNSDPVTYNGQGVSYG